MMNVKGTMVGVPRYATTRPEVTFAHVIMDTRLTWIDVLVMVSDILYYCIISLCVLIDIDECVYFTPCAQHCHNTEGSYNCSCIEGFASDGPYCVNNSGEVLADYY